MWLDQIILFLVELELNSLAFHTCPDTEEVQGTSSPWGGGSLY